MRDQPTLNDQRALQTRCMPVPQCCLDTKQSVGAHSRRFFDLSLEASLGDLAA